MNKYLDELKKALNHLENANNIQEFGKFHICNLDFIIEKMKEYIFRSELRIDKEK